jgi:hypothetical protein
MGVHVNARPLLSRYVAGARIHQTPKVNGFVVLLACVQASIETIEISHHIGLFAVFALSRYEDKSTL